MATRISRAEKLNFISNLGTMLNAGISLLDAIESLQEESKGGQKKILQKLFEDVSQGRKISDSLAKFPEAFDAVDIHLIRAAEQAGTLDTTLSDMTITIKKEMELAEKVSGALTYPGLVVIVFILILIIILTAVIPKISMVFSQLNIELPLPTRVMIWMSDAVIHHTALLIGVIAALIVLVVFLLRTQRRRLIRMMFGLPGLAPLAKDMDVTRLTRSLALLLNSGIPIVDALGLVQEVVVRRDMVKVILHAQDLITSGQSISQAFKDYKPLIPPLVIRMTQAGEKTGTLSKSMQDIAEYFDGQVTRRVKILTTMLEPAMLVVISGTVGGMMLAIIAPIYGLIGQITVH